MQWLQWRKWLGIALGFIIGTAALRHPVPPALIYPSFEIPFDHAAHILTVWVGTTTIWNWLWEKLDEY